MFSHIVWDHALIVIQWLRSCWRLYDDLCMWHLNWWESGWHLFHIFLFILWFIFFRFLDQFNGYNDFKRKAPSRLNSVDLKYAILDRVLADKIIWTSLFWRRSLHTLYWKWVRFLVFFFASGGDFDIFLIENGDVFSHLLKVRTILSLSVGTVLSVFWKWDDFDGVTCGCFDSLLKMGAPD